MDVAGFGLPNAKTSAVQGYSVDVMTAIAKHCGPEIQIVPFAAFGDVLPAPLAKQIDISATAISSTVDVNEENIKRVVKLKNEAVVKLKMTQKSGKMMNSVGCASRSGTIILVVKARVLGNFSPSPSSTDVKALRA